MLGKLMKYEVKCCGRTFFPLYIVTLLFSILGGLFINFDDGSHDFVIVYAIGFLVAFALFVAMIVVTIVLIVQRFNKSFLGDEGYLMFTLPVGEKTLVLSKFLTALLFIILTAIVSMVSISLVGAILSYKINDIFDMGYMFNLIGQIASGNIGNIAFHLFSSIVDYSVFILTIYLTITVAHLPVFSKHKAISALGTFIILTVAQTVIFNLVDLAMSSSLSESFIDSLDSQLLEDPSNIISFFNAALSIYAYQVVNLIVNLVIAVASFFGISFLLERKLNLE